MSDPDETSVVRGSFSVRDRLLLTGLLALGVAAMFAGYTHVASKGFVNALSRLHSLGFVENQRGEGTERATHLLFPTRGRS